MLHLTEMARCVFDDVPEYRLYYDDDREMVIVVDGETEGIVMQWRLTINDLVRQYEVWLDS